MNTLENLNALKDGGRQGGKWGVARIKRGEGCRIWYGESDTPEGIRYSAILDLIDYEDAAKLVAAANALPQLLALAEAAEDVVTAHLPFERIPSDVGDAVGELRAALVALGSDL
jgi:hypothetical protein